MAVPVQQQAWAASLAVAVTVASGSGCRRAGGPPSGGVQPELQEPQLREKAEAFLQDAALPADLHVWRVGTSVEQGSIAYDVVRGSGPPDRARAMPGRMYLRKTDGRVTLFGLEGAESGSTGRAVSREEAQSIAETFVRRHYPELWSRGQVGLTVRPSPDARTHTVIAARDERGFRTPCFGEVYVRAEDGRVVGYVRGAVPYTIPDTVISRHAAEATAARAAARSFRVRRERLKVLRANLSFYSRPGRVRTEPVWSVVLDWQRQEPPGRCHHGAQVAVHATTGRVLDVTDTALGD